MPCDEMGFEPSIMRIMKNTAITLLMCTTCGGCAEYVPREHDEAMLFYRECMNQMQPLGTVRSTEALSNPDTRQSMVSVIKNQVEYDRQADCSQSATWRER